MKGDERVFPEDDYEREIREVPFDGLTRKLIWVVLALLVLVLVTSCKKAPSSVTPEARAAQTEAHHVKAKAPGPAGCTVMLDDDSTLEFGEPCSAVPACVAIGRDGTEVTSIEPCSEAK